MKINLSALNKISNKQVFYKNLSAEPKSTSSELKAQIPVSKLSSENIKANFLPSFGKFKTVDYAYVIDKDTDKYKKAKLQKEMQGDYGCYKLVIAKEEAGRMDIKYDSPFPEEDMLPESETDKNFPEVRHLRSFLGNKYSGIGTVLINRAILDSKNAGKNGKLWLSAESGYDYSSSSYRSLESPIPFYYKLGFKSPDESVDKEIQKYIDKKRYNMLPEEALLILPEENVHIAEDYYNKKFADND